MYITCSKKVSSCRTRSSIQRCLLYNFTWMAPFTLLFAFMTASALPRGGRPDVCDWNQQPDRSCLANGPAVVCAGIWGRCRCHGRTEFYVSAGMCQIGRYGHQSGCCPTAEGLFREGSTSASPSTSTLSRWGAMLRVTLISYDSESDCGVR
jgi:hypothetical protein